MPLSARHATHIRIGLRLARLDIAAFEAGYHYAPELHQYPRHARHAYQRALAAYWLKRRHRNCRCTSTPVVTVTGNVTTVEADGMLRSTATTGSFYMNGMP